MNLKDTKIFIPEIPKEWERRTRSGHTNTWNDPFHRNGLPEVSLEPPMRGLYAERFDDGWYWVCGCNKCLGNGQSYSYIVCEDHNRCVTCNTHRKDLTETPWGHPDGFECQPCTADRKEELKLAALARAKELNLDEWDHYREDKIICPVCFSENSNDDMHQSNEYDLACSVCDTEFAVEVEYDPKYTSSLKK
ncbi:transposase-like protein [Paenibacillus shirakamiensis]|uniref:Transposase-like protein n=1 Tax=Paenibacillus shirakamiensis TaxID=1265935 RepID=A0ABS4JF90_9BACL|nr:hypothetical protein [Paenibacillus shirakamiensis]MBP1999735.1 transposase-like protein [Paenibacillus shirakamiensis]